MRGELSPIVEENRVDINFPILNEREYSRIGKVQLFAKNINSELIHILDNVPFMGDIEIKLLVDGKELVRDIDYVIVSVKYNNTFKRGIKILNMNIMDLPDETPVELVATRKVNIAKAIYNSSDDITVSLADRNNMYTDTAPILRTDYIATSTGLYIEENELWHNGKRILLDGNNFGNYTFTENIQLRYIDIRFRCKILSGTPVSLLTIRTNLLNGRSLYIRCGHTTSSPNKLGIQLHIDNYYVNNGISYSNIFVQENDLVDMHIRVVNNTLRVTYTVNGIDYDCSINLTNASLIIGGTPILARSFLTTNTKIILLANGFENENKIWGSSIESWYLDINNILFNFSSISNNKTYDIVDGTKYISWFTNGYVPASPVIENYNSNVDNIKTDNNEVFATRELSDTDEDFVPTLNMCFDDVFNIDQITLYFDKVFDNQMRNFIGLKVSVLNRQDVVLGVTYPTTISEDGIITISEFYLPDVNNNPTNIYAEKPIDISKIKLEIPYEDSNIGKLIALKYIEIYEDMEYHGINKELNIHMAGVTRYIADNKPIRRDTIYSGTGLWELLIHTASPIAQYDNVLQHLEFRDVINTINRYHEYNEAIGEELPEGTTIEKKTIYASDLVSIVELIDDPEWDSVADPIDEGGTITSSSVKLFMDRHNIISMNKSVLDIRFFKIYGNPSIDGTLLSSATLAIAQDVANILYSGFEVIFER